MELLWRSLGWLTWVTCRCCMRGMVAVCMAPGMPDVCLESLMAHGVKDHPILSHTIPLAIVRNGCIS
eukprot:scaffold100563_cov14-Tisochrysis_lutea.AAC.1